MVGVPGKAPARLQFLRLLETPMAAAVAQTATVSRAGSSPGLWTVPRAAGQILGLELPWPTSCAPGTRAATSPRWTAGST